MNRDQITQALMFYAPQAKWEFTPMIDMENAGYTNIIWKDPFYKKPTMKELQQYYRDSVEAYKNQVLYKLERQHHYPSVEEQLDFIYHNGIDAWKERIKAVKDKFPKK